MAPILCKLSIASADAAAHYIVQIIKIMLTTIRLTDLCDYTPSQFVSFPCFLKR
jgi:hypothetical protein